MKSKQQWNMVRSRYIPAVWPFICYFSWPINEIIPNGYTKEWHVWENGNVLAVWEQKCTHVLRKGVMEILYQNKNNLSNFRKKGQKSGSNVLNYCEEFIKDIEDKKLPEFLEFFRGFLKKYHEIMRTSMVFWVFGTKAVEEKLDYLLKKFDEIERKDILSVMSITPDESYSKKAERLLSEIIALAKKQGFSEEINKKINFFSKQYYWFPYEYVGPEIWDEKRVKQLVEEGFNEETEQEKTIDVKKLQKKCIKKYKLSTEIVDIFQIMQTLTLMQDDRKMYNSHICYYVNNIIMKKLAKLIGLGHELARYVDDAALEKFIKNNDLNWLRKKMGARKEFCIQRSLPNGTNEFYEGDEGKRMLEKEGIKLRIDFEVDELKGRSAYPGIVQGKVKIVKSSSQASHFEKGDILVTGMTTPDFAPLMKKAEAIITDEGGITCHAAIVARELKKPCVIGTKIATRVLKNGDLVEVNADKGTVKILKKSD